MSERFAAEREGVDTAGAPDASERGSVDTAGAPDASDAFDAAESTAEDAADAAPVHRGSPGKRAVPRPRARLVSSPSAARATAPVALLDSSSPDLLSAPRELDPAHGASALDAAEPFECSTAREVHYALWPVLAPLRGTGLLLVSLSLTTPREDTVLEDGACFAADVGARPGEGAILARDIGPLHGRGHFHGPALTCDPAELCERWCRRTGASSQHVRHTPITGWPDAAHTTFGNLGTVLAYAFKPWPLGHGRRSLDADVFASGVLLAPWRAARAAIDAPPMLDADRPSEASRKRRKCGQCGRVFLLGKPGGRRPQAIWCSTRCRRASWEDRHQRHPFEGSKPSGGTPNDAP